MRNVSSPRPPRSAAWILGLFAASFVFLVGGALLAVSFEGWARLLIAVLGFAGYLFYFSRAFRDLLPRDFSEADPGPMRRVEKQKTTVTALSRHHAAATVLLCIVSAISAG